MGIGGHLRFADDIVLITDCVDEAKEMLAKLSHASNQALKKITLDSRNVDQIVMYKSLGHKLLLGRANQTCEIFCQMRLAWKAQKLGVQN